MNLDHARQALRASRRTERTGAVGERNSVSKESSNSNILPVGLSLSVALKRKVRDVWAAAKWGAVLATVLGVVVLLFQDTPLERWSYDLPQVVGPQVDITNVAIVYMDDATHALRKQPYDAPWDRFLPAQLVEVLKQAGAKAIAFDEVFDPEGTNVTASQALARALRSHGKVVLAADLGSSDYYGIALDIKPKLPQAIFLAATPYWGFSQLWVDGDDTVRQHFHGWEDVPSLSWKLASLLDVKATKEANGQRRKRWLNYYGHHGTLPSISFDKALDGSNQAVRELFRDRVVFVGSATQSGYSGKRRDQFHTPYWGRTEPLWPGVDFHAIQFLNLMRGDWLRRMDPFVETGLVALCGLMAGLGLGSLKPRAATFTALGAAALVAVAACLLVWQTHIWFAWLVVAVVQIPVALVCSVVRRVESEMLLSPADRTTDFAAAGAGRRLAIPDHEMLRRIGSGSYGEVWLGRSATGTFRAVKIVDRKSAQDPRFDREFAGLKKFEPISRAHEGFVDILHVGRNEAAGVLYYVMELADSCAMVSGEDGEGYVPTTLKTKLQAGEPLDAGKLARLTLSLTSALAFLHEQGLIHRDIKPSNIIFVQKEPKLADIGLVAATDETHSFVGTEGYIPPEGPGTPAADVYSLGKVLSEVLAQSNPESASEKKMLHLRQVIEQACARTLARRYQNGQEMYEKLRAALVDQ